MKSCIRMTLLCGLIYFLFIAAPVSAQFAQSIGGTAVGYEFKGPNDGDMWTLQFIGTNITPRSWVDTTQHALYGVIQFADVDTPPAGGLGGKVIYVTKTRWDGLYMLFGLGWIQDVAENSNGSMTAGITLEAGVSISVAKNFNLIFYGVSMDRGPDLSVDGFVGIGIDNLSSFVGGIL